MITARRIATEVANKEHLLWTDVEKLERLEVLENAEKICLDILENILERDACGRHFFEGQLVEIRQHKELCMVETTIEERYSTIQKGILWFAFLYCLFWVIFIVGAVLYGE